MSTLEYKYKYSSNSLTVDYVVYKYAHCGTRTPRSRYPCRLQYRRRLERNWENGFDTTRKLGTHTFGASVHTLETTYDLSVIIIKRNR